MMTHSQFSVSFLCCNSQESTNEHAWNGILFQHWKSQIYLFWLVWKGNKTDWTWSVMFSQCVGRNKIAGNATIDYSLYRSSAVNIEFNLLVENYSFIIQKRNKLWNSINLVFIGLIVIYGWEIKKLYIYCDLLLKSCEIKK